MPARPTPQKGDCIHVTIRCNNKLFLLDVIRHWFDIVSWIDCLPYNFTISLHHVMVMSNHIHMILTLNKDNMGQAMCYFMTNLSKFLNAEHRSVNHIFGGRYYATIINTEKYLINVIKYLYQNPVRAGLVESVFDYKYSSLSLYTEGNSQGFVIAPDPFTKTLFEQGLKGRDIWIEHVTTLYNQNEVSVMKQSLQRFRLQFAKRQLQALDLSTSSLVF